MILRGLCFIGMAAGCVGFFVFFKRLFTEKIGALIASAVGKLFGVIQRAADKLMRKLGFTRRRNAFGGTDSVEFFYTGKDITGRKKATDKLPKWKDLPDNRSRTRFIYIKYLRKMIKKGWGFRYSVTPDVIARETAESPGEKLIFSCYDVARYAPPSYEITDGQVDEMLEAESMKR